MKLFPRLSQFDGLQEEFGKQAIAAGNVIFNGEDRSLIGLIHRGTVKKIGLAQGKFVAQRTLDFFGENQWVDLITLHQELNAYEFRASTDVELTYVPSGAVRTFCPELLLAMSRQLTLELHFKDVSLMIGRLDLKLRILHTLFTLRMKIVTPEIRFTLDDLADMTGTHKSKVSPEMKRLAERGFILARYGQYVIPEGEALIQEGRREFGKMG